MNLRQHIKKLAIVGLLLAGVQVAFAAFSFSGMTDDKTKAGKYSLKNLSSLSHKAMSYSSLRSTLLFKGISSSKEGSNGTEVNSMLRYDNGNTTYIYPYKFKVKVPKFKTPTPPDHR